MKNSDILRIVSVKLQSQGRLVQDDFQQPLHDIIPVLVRELLIRATEIDAESGVEPKVIEAQEAEIESVKKKLKRAK